MSASDATATAAKDILQTPILDSERPNLLQQITEEGGYAYVRMATLAAEGDMRAAEAAKEMAWEQLHSGPWHSVVPIWRDAYAMACLHVAKLQYAAGEFSLVLRALDMGLIMGGLTLRDDLNSAIKTASKKARLGVGSLKLDIEDGGEEDKKSKLIVSEEVDVAERYRCGNVQLLKHRVQTLLQLIIELQHFLPVKSLSSKTVGRRSSLSLEGFLRDYFLPGTPVVISDCMADWPAKSKWNNMNYLKKIAGFRTIPVEVGKNYLCQDWKQELITFSEFLERIQSNDCTSADTTYLAQHPLFDQIQELHQDIIIPYYCFAGGGEMRSLNAWFGPAGTVTPLHHDPHHNILAQVVGKKYVRLYSASLSEELYPHTEFMLRNSSQVDLDNIDEKEFPKVVNLEFCDCILNEGEMLYIPPKWWHYVRSLTTSFSVSFWWSDIANSSTS